MRGLVVLLLSMSVALAVEPAERLADPAMEARAHYQAGAHSGKVA